MNTTQNRPDTEEVQKKAVQQVMMGARSIADIADSLEKTAKTLNLSKMQPSTEGMNLADRIQFPRLTRKWWLIMSGLVVLSGLVLAKTIPVEPNVHWEVTAANSAGLDEERLDRLVEMIGERHTTALVVARSGHLVREWYASYVSPNHRHGLAAAAKGIVASVLMLAMVDDGHVALDDLALRYIPDWERIPMRSRITLRQLASHRSGMEDLWGGDYQRQRSDRFRVALDKASIDFEPGTRQQYSGTAFYPLAFALSVALRNTWQPDLRGLLNSRVMLPLEIPPEAWRISYNESYERDGLTLYAIGSGANFTARAVARIGQMILNQGRWNRRQILSQDAIQALVTGGWVLPERIGKEPEPRAHLGWWLNIERFSPSLPCDAMVALGNKYQMLLVVPSLDLVAVRQGGALVGKDEPIWPSIERYLFKPLMAAIQDRPNQEPSCRSGRN